MTIMRLAEDSRYRSYSDRINFTPEGYEVFARVADYLGKAQRYDYNKIDKLPSSQTPSFTSRYKDLMLTWGVTEPYAKTIVNDNDATLDLAWRNHKANRHEWHKDIAHANKVKTRKSKARAERAERLLEKTSDGPSVCLGGKDHWKRAQQDPIAMEDFKKRRYWLGCTGRGPSYSKQKDTYHGYMGNQMIRVDLEGDVSIVIPKGLWEKYGVHRGNNRVVIGNIKYNHGWEQIKHNIEYHKSITYHARFINGHWKLHAQLQLEPIEKGKDKIQRIVGVDLNAGHVEVCLLDQFGNRIGSPMTLSYEKRGLRETVEKVVAFATRNGAMTIAIEDLTGLQRSCTRRSGRALNRVVNNIPTGQFETLLETITEDRGLVLEKVDPKNTSKNTSQWRDLFKKNTTTHQIASYLIGRRGLGYRISRRLSIDSGQSRATPVISNQVSGNTNSQSRDQVLLDSS